jgi:hypothetical protein
MLMRRVLDQAPAELREWLNRGWSAASTRSPTHEDLAPWFASASRKLRGLGFAETLTTTGAIEESGPVDGVAGTADHAWRVALYLNACDRLSTERQSDLTFRMFQTGDSAERCAILRALAYTPDPAVMLGTAIEACRSNVANVFEAIACENAYPAAWFPEPAFNQMVMKAVFSGIALSRVTGLEGRLNPELERMAKDFAAERRAAGRPVPADLELVTAKRCRS